MNTKKSLLVFAAALAVPALFALIPASSASTSSCVEALSRDHHVSDLSFAGGAVTSSGRGAARNAAQDTGSGFVITLKNGSSVRGKTLTRDQASGTLRLTMTQDGSGQPKSYAMIAMDDADSIRASSSDTDSIQVKVHGGSVIRCKEFSLSPDTITLKIGTRSTINVPWDQIESISFAQ